MACDKERKLVEELQGDHAAAREDCSQGIKAQCARVDPLFKKLVKARAALQECLDPLGAVTILPRYLVTNLLYNPPGVGSETSYSVGSTAGITTDVSHSFEAGAQLAASSDVLGTGVEVSLEVKGGVKTGTSFEITKEKHTGISLESITDGVDHSQDRFLIWTNIRADIRELSDGRVGVGLGLSGDGDLDLVSLTVAQLRDPSLIPEFKKASLANFSSDDFSNILGLHPLLNTPIIDPGRFKKVRTLQISGPDHPNDGPLFYTGQLSDTQASGTIKGASHEITVGFELAVGVGPPVLAKVQLKAGNTWTWTYETDTNITAGRVEEAEVKLGSSTVGYHEVIDVYADMMFKVFAFVSRFGQLPNESAVVTGIVTDQAQQPVSNQRVDVTMADGEVHSTVTNSQGIYRIFGAPEGVFRVQVSDKIREVNIIQGQPIDLSLQIAVNG